jgi:hypothetical protein
MTMITCSRSLRIVSALSLAIAAVACGPSVSSSPAPRVVADTAAAGDASAAHAPSQAADSQPGPVLHADAASDAPERACVQNNKPDGNTTEMKQSEEAYLDCLKGEVEKARAASIASLPASDPRIGRTHRVETAWAALTADVCWASEEVQWVDFDDGVRYDGTLRGFASLACHQGSRIELARLFHALATKDGSGFSRHVDTAQSRGRRQASMLRDLVTKARIMAARPALRAPAADALPEHIDAAARKRYVARLEAIERNATDVARETCDLLASFSLATADAACTRHVTTAFLALGTFSGR